MTEPRPEPSYLYHGRIAGDTVVGWICAVIAIVALLEWIAR